MTETGLTVSGFLFSEDLLLKDSFHPLDDFWRLSKQLLAQTFKLVTMQCGFSFATLFLVLTHRMNFRSVRAAVVNQ